MSSNLENFPNNVKPVEKYEYDGESYSVYGFKFEGIYDLYNYLIADPEINEGAFGNKYRVSSITNDSDFAGKPYDIALKELLDSDDERYGYFLRIGKAIETSKKRSVSRFVPYNSVSGGVIRPEAIATGDPHIYRSAKVIQTEGYININALIGYNCGNTKEQVFNRAIILTNVINALEENGYQVNVNAFETSLKGGGDHGEIIKILFKIKRGNSGINYQALYRSMCYVEFFRRLLFRVFESSDVSLYWGGTYGRTIEKPMNVDLLGLDKKDLYFDQPSSMEIRGYDLVEDFERAINNLGLNDKINVKREKEKIRRLKNNLVIK